MKSASGATDVPITPGHRRRWPWVAFGGLIGAAAFVLVWYQPQKLFIDDRVDQAVPTARAPDTTASSGGEPAEPNEARQGQTTPTEPPRPIDLVTGTFVSLDHATTGTVRVLELADGRRFVRLERFETENGPDLYVYLSSNPAGGPEGAFDDDIANLGRLQGNIGDQNYELPPDVQPDAYASVVIWCDRFDSAFGAADLAASPA